MPGSVKTILAPWHAREQHMFRAEGLGFRDFGGFGPGGLMFGVLGQGPMLRTTPELPSKSAV